MSYLCKTIHDKRCQKNFVEIIILFILTYYFEFSHTLHFLIHKKIKDSVNFKINYCNFFLILVYFTVKISFCSKSNKVKWMSLKAQSFSHFLQNRANTVVRVLYIDYRVCFKKKWLLYFAFLVIFLDFQTLLRYIFWKCKKYHFRIV